jgi:electron transfer flavoprotein alpha subunit
VSAQGGVWAWLESARDGAPTGAEEVLAVAARASRGLGAELQALVFGEPAPALLAAAARRGATRVRSVATSGGGALGPEARVEALARALAQASPRLVVFEQSFDARAVAPRAAARLGAAVLMNALDVEAVPGGALRVTASAYGGDTRVLYEQAGGALLLGVIPTGVSPGPAAEGPAPPVEPFELDLSGVEERVRVLESARREGPRLEEAQVVVAGGRGLGTRENYALVEELAAALGGLAGASRPLVDEGWVDSSRQVGLTGRITRPALYVAIGISGASQHMAGCSAARTIVAVNRDPDAAIFRYARYGLVGDCSDLLPELIREARRRASEPSA